MTTAERKRPYQNLLAWQVAHELCLFTYDVLKKFPQNEQFALVTQMQKSSYSVPTNIAEGSGKKSLKERDRFYEYSWCSLEELHYQFLLARDLLYITNVDFENAEKKIGRVGYFLSRLRSSLK